MTSRVTAIVLAAGAGERLGGAEPKGFRTIGERPLVAWAAANAAACERVTEIVVAVPAGDEDRARALLDLAKPVAVIAGGASRHESVRLALERARADADAVICHDAARPFAGAEVFDGVLDALSGADGAVPVLAIPDTVKRVRAGAVIGTEDRTELWLAQTPQAFRAAALRDGHERARAAGMEFTDDSAVMEWAGYRVVAVPGSWRNFKITNSMDLERARLFVEEAERGGAKRG